MKNVKYEEDFTDNKSWEVMKEEMLKENGPDIRWLIDSDVSTSTRRTIHNWFSSTSHKRLSTYESLADLHKRFYQARERQVLWEIINQFHQVYRRRFKGTPTHELEPSHTDEEIMNLFRSKYITDLGKSLSSIYKKFNTPDNPYPNGFKMEDVLSNAEDEYFYQWKENWEFMEEQLEEFKKDLEKEFNLS